MAQLPEEQCLWQLGGAFIPDTTNLFGGSSTTVFGSLLGQVYARPTGTVVRFNTFRRILDHNPCQPPDGEMENEDN